MKLSILAAAAAALLSTSFAAAPADAQRGDRDRERTVVRTTTVVHRDNGNHYGWRNKHHRKVKVCRTVWRHHHRDRVCTWRYR
jgi:hypothetical protein